MDYLRNQLRTQWIACRAICDKRSIQYGIRFSYPIFITLVVIGVYSENLSILFAAALVALLGMKLPMHPFDYVYNLVVTKLINKYKIPGRGSELQVNSTVAFIFTLCVIASILFGVRINYSILAIIYILSSIFFLLVLLFRTISNAAK